MKSVKMSSLLILLTRHKYLLCFLGLAITSSYFDASVLALHHNNQDLKEVKVGFVENLNERWGTMAHHFVKMAITDFYEFNPNYTTRLILRVRDSQNNDVITSAANVVDLIQKEQVIAIIGPETSQEAQFDISLGERSKVPIISYSASSPMLSSPYFIQATQNDSSQVQAISSIVQAFRWREVTPVYVNNEFGRGIIPFLVDALQQINTRIPYICLISSSATDDQIEHELSKLKLMQTRVFVVHMNETLASRVFLLASKSGMMSSGYVWIITSNIANTLGYLGHEVIQSMQGVLGVKTHVPMSKAVKMAKIRWTTSYEEARDLKLWNLQMSLFGLWAYDATFLLAKAVEQVHESNFTFVPEVKNSSSSNSSLSSSALSFLTSRVPNVGPNLTKELLRTSFKGLSGSFSLDDNGKLRSCTFEIINVVGSGEKKIGFWTPEKGLNITSPVITWPGGDKAATPMGWAIDPTNETRLRVGVPFKVGFTEFVEASMNDSSIKPTGFCIELFEAVRNKLGYDLPVQYIPSTASYDDLLSQVHSKKFDAIVGDVTIRANRYIYVDFTAPYMDANVLMVAPKGPKVKDSRANRAWAFLKPLSWKLWVTSLCFFILIAFVVWVNEYQINEDFRAESWRGQIGLCLYFSFSTMVFSHKELPKSNLSRFVMVCWLFTLLLLTQTYTASLASILTVEKLHYKDINELLRADEKVGCQNGSFIKYYLLRRMKVRDSNIITYDTPEELHSLLSKGSEGGGIDAAFDEAPYINLFLSRYCSYDYISTVVSPASTTDGFAFAFSIGSPLVSDISRELIKLKEEGSITKLWNKWMNQTEDCSIDPSTAQSSAALDLDSFVALFAITGGASVAAVVWKLASFFYENRPLWKTNGGKSLKKRLRELNRTFHVKKGSQCSSSAVSPDFGICRESSRVSALHTNSAAATEVDVI